MKKLPYILNALLLIALVGLLLWDYLPDRNVEGSALTRFGLLTAGVIYSTIRLPMRAGRQTLRKKSLYTKAYAEFIDNVFPEDRKLEKQFFDAVDDYNHNRYDAGLRKLESLRSQCFRTNERYAVTVFTALCMHELGLNEQAAEQYRAALGMRRNSTISSNLGIVLERLGKAREAQEAYELSIQLDPKNAYPYNNLAQLYLRESDYESAMECASKALELDSKMTAAMNAMAISSHQLGDQAGCEEWLRKAAANGSDAAKVKRYIASLDAAR